MTAAFVLFAVAEAVNNARGDCDDVFQRAAEFHARHVAAEFHHEVVRVEQAVEFLATSAESAAMVVSLYMSAAISFAMLAPLSAASWVFFTLVSS